MATEDATKLNQMFRNIPDQSGNLEDNVSQLQDIKDELEEQVDAVDNALLDVAANRLKSFLDGKALALQNGYTYRGIWEQGVSFNTNDTVVIATDDPFIDSTSIDSAHYQSLSDHTSTENNFPPNSPLFWVSIPYNATTYRAKLKSGYNSINLTAWAVQNQQLVIPPPPPILPPALAWVDVYSLTVNWDSNTQVSGLVSDWNYGYDLLTKELDETGTYGLLAQIDNIDTAITLLTNNKNKIDGGLNVYPDYLP